MHIDTFNIMSAIDTDLKHWYVHMHVINMYLEEKHQQQSLQYVYYIQFPEMRKKILIFQHHLFVVSMPGTERLWRNQLFHLLVVLWDGCRLKQ